MYIMNMSIPADPFESYDYATMIMTYVFFYTLHDYYPYGYYHVNYDYATYMFNMCMLIMLYMFYHVDVDYAIYFYQVHVDYVI